MNALHLSPPKISRFPPPSKRAESRTPAQPLGHPRTPPLPGWRRLGKPRSLLGGGDGPTGGSPPSRGAPEEVGGAKRGAPSRRPPSLSQSAGAPAGSFPSPRSARPVKPSPAQPSPVQPRWPHLPASCSVCAASRVSAAPAPQPGLFLKGEGWAGPGWEGREGGVSGLAPRGAPKGRGRSGAQSARAPG